MLQRRESDVAWRGTDVIRVLVNDPDPLASAGLRAVFDDVLDIEVISDLDDPTQVDQIAPRARPHVAVLSVTDSGRSSSAVIARVSAAGVAVLTLTLDEDDGLLLSTLESGASGNRVKSAGPDELVRAVRSLGQGRTALSDRQSRILLDGWLRNRRRVESLEAQRAAGLLTLREREIVRAVTRGRTNRQIAVELHCAPSTVKAHLATVFTRLGVANRVELAILGLRAGLLDD